MLQSIRDRTQGWFAGVIISLLILSFGLWGIHSYFVGNGQNNVVAKVNSVEITKGQLAVAYERMHRQMQSQLNSEGELNDSLQANLKKEALQTLITAEVLKQASLKQKYRISLQQIESFLENIPDFQVNGQFSVARFQQIIAVTMLTVQDFLELIKTSLLIDQPRLGVIFTSYSLPNEVFDTYTLIGQERLINYVILPFNYFKKQAIEISEEKLQDYYQTHQNEFRTPEQVAIEYIDLSMNQLMAEVHTTDEVLKSFYNENTSSYSLPAKWKLEGVRIPLEENASKEAILTAQNLAKTMSENIHRGLDFSQLTKKFPSVNKINEESISSNYLTLNQVPNEWQKAVLNLTKVGQVSEPISTSKGILLLRVIAYQGAEIQAFEKVKNKVKETFIRQQAEEKFAAIKEKLANITYEHPDTLLPAAKALNLVPKKTGLFTREKGENIAITKDTKVRSIAFSNEVLNQQNNSDVIQITPDSMMVLRVSTHIPPTLLSLQTVRNQIIDRLKDKEVEMKTLELANEIKTKLKLGDSLANISTTYHLPLKNPGFINRHSSNQVDSAILSAVFEMPKPEDGKRFSIAKTASGFAIISLEAIRENSLNSNNRDQYIVYAEQIQNSQGLLEYELYKQSQLARAKIVVNG